VALELNDNMVSGEDWAECVSLGSKETESVTFEDKRVIETSLYGSLS